MDTLIKKTTTWNHYFFRFKWSFALQHLEQQLIQAFSGIGELQEGLTFGVMLFVIQKARCCWMLSMLWQCCCFVVRRYFCRARAMEGKMAWAASRGSITSPGVFFCSSSCIRLICVNASSTATTRLEGNTASQIRIAMTGLEFGSRQYDWSIHSSQTHLKLSLLNGEWLIMVSVQHKRIKY